MSTISVSVTILSNDVVRIQLKDADFERYEVPIEIETNLAQFPVFNENPPLVAETDGNIVISRVTRFLNILKYFVKFDENYSNFPLLFLQNFSKKIYCIQHRTP